MCREDRYLLYIVTETDEDLGLFDVFYCQTAGTFRTNSQPFSSTCLVLVSEPKYHPGVVGPVRHGVCF